MISTKILVPQRRRNVLRRPRLVNLIRRHIDRTLTLISASAGYGKTALLIDFCHDDPPCPVCWFSLDESDRDINNFVNHFVAAIQHQFPNFGEKTRQALEANPNLAHDPSTLGNVITQDISENVSEFFVLVLDDYHVLDTLIPVGELLEVILKYAHSRWHLIVAGRTAPSNLPIILLTAQEQITFVGQEELAFTVTEVQGLMQNRHNVNLTPEQAQELLEVSEGWITGLLLATESLWLGMRDTLARARTQQGPIYAYLATQVFEQQPQALQDTMLTMSTLPEMNEALCQQALGLSGVKHVLQELERRGLFLTTLIDERGVRHYRYHHLFRDFLQTRLQNHNPSRFCQLHQRAADWFEAQEDWTRAVLHRLAAGDARATAQTMENGAKPLYLTRRLETLVTWHEKVPASLRPEFPRLLLFVARAMFDLGRADEAMLLLHQAEATFRERGETERTLYTMLQRATIWYTWGRHTDMLTVAQKVLKLTNLPAPTDEAHRLAGLACLSLGKPEEAVNHLSKSLDLCRELGAVKEIAMTYLNLSLALLRLGRLSEGWTCQDKAIELLRQLGPSNYLAMTLNDIACERYYLAGDYKQALSLLREALEVARTASSPRAQAFALLSTADLYRDLGAPKEAQKLYTQAEEIARRSDQAAPITFALLGAAQILIQTGDVVKALGLAVQARDQAQRRGDVYQLGLSCLTLGTIYLGIGDIQTALGEIERGRSQLEQSNAQRDLTRAYVLLARAHQAAGDVEEALKTLSQALNIGIETQAVHYLVVEGQHVFDLLRRLLQQNPSDRRPAQIMDRIRALPDVACEVVGKPVPTARPRHSTLRFYGFGPGRVEKDGQTVTWNSAIARHMTFHLLTHPPRNREQLFALFWPDTAPDDARATFHWTKYQARKVLGRNLIVYEDGYYKIAWDPDCWFDVSAFEALLDERDGERQAHLEEALSLYQGDFLEGCDDEWCLSTREYLRARYRDALVELGRLYMEKDKPAQALPTLNRAVALDDLYEPAIQTLMHFYALDGRPRAALDLFHQLEQRLQELRALPGQKTQALYRSIQTGSSYRRKLA